MNCTQSERSIRTPRSLLLAPSYYFRQHLRQKLHRQPDNVRLAPFDNMHPAQPILIAKRARFAFPLPRGDVLIELLVGKLDPSEAW